MDKEKNYLISGKHLHKKIPPAIVPHHITIKAPLFQKAGTMSMTDNNGNTDNGTSDGTGGAHEAEDNAQKNVPSHQDADIADFRLPTDVHQLAQMRDLLADYLGTLERNTDAVSEWLTEEQDNIILSHHQLVRAISRKDESAATGILESAQAQGIAGFVLSLQDFTKLSTAAFGAKSALSTLTQKIPHDPPDGILEALPSLIAPNETNHPPALIVQEPEAPAETPKKKKGFWSAIKESFTNAEKKAAEEKARQEQERQRQEEETRRRWHTVRKDLISLQSDRHYYVDSFMDWIGESLAPERSAPGDNIDHLMDTYQSPQYVIDAARHDYDRVIGAKTEILHQKALEYSTFAKFIDEYDINAFADMMPKLFSRDDLQREKQYRRILLQDMAAYGDSFVALSLSYPKTREDQFRLLESALRYEDKISLPGRNTPKEIFDHIFNLVTDQKDPLNPRALSLVAEKLKQCGHAPESYITRAHFINTAERFSKDTAGFTETLGSLLTSIAPYSAGKEKTFTSLIRALDSDDVTALRESTNEIIRKNEGASVKALFELCYPDSSLLDRIIAVSAKPHKHNYRDYTGATSTLVSMAATSGMTDEFKNSDNGVVTGTTRFFSFFERHGLSKPERLSTFNFDAFRQLMAHTLMYNSIDMLRDKLTKPDGWLSQVVGSGLDTHHVNTWIATMLEPFSSDIARANILFEAAKNADGDTRDTLLALEEQFGSHNVRLSDGKLLTNIEKIPNIWYNNERNTILFTLNGTEHVLMEGVSDKAAEDILSYIKRKGDFMTEFDGLFRPDNIDRIVTRTVGPSHNTEMFWAFGDGALHVTKAQAEALHQRNDFLTERLPTEVFSINRKSITLLQPRKHDHLLIDKYGEALSLTGQLSLPSTAGTPFIRLQDGTLFNPENASIMRLDSHTSSLRFRIESLDFENYLKKTDSGEYQYRITLSDADMKKVSAALHASPNIAPVMIDQQRTAYFNFGAIGYMLHEDKTRNPGFQCLRHSAKNKPAGFIPADDALAKKINTYAPLNDKIIHVENLLLHKDRIDDAYYNEEKKKIFFVVGSDILQASVSMGHAHKILQDLSKEQRFSVVGTADMGQTPVDVLCRDKTFLYFNSAATEKSYAMTVDKDIELGLSASQFKRYIDRLENSGIPENTHAPWVETLRDTMAAMQPFEARETHSLKKRDDGYLFLFLNNRENAHRLPNPSKDFRTATYPPEQTHKLAGAETRSKKYTQKKPPKP
jgi:hypothetical protein